MDFSVYEAITEREFLKQAWTKRNAELLAPNLKAAIRRFNHTNKWVATEVHPMWMAVVVAVVGRASVFVLCFFRMRNKSGCHRLQPVRDPPGVTHTHTHHLRLFSTRPHQVVRGGSIEDRVHSICFMLDVAAECKRLNNFNSLMAIIRWRAVAWGLICIARVMGGLRFAVG